MNKRKWAAALAEREAGEDTEAQHWAAVERERAEERAYWARWADKVRREVGLG